MTTRGPAACRAKALVKTVRSVHTINAASRFGVAVTEPVVDSRSVMGRVNSVAQGIFERESEEKLRAEGIDVIEGEARFINSKTVLVNGRERSRPAVT